MGKDLFTRKLKIGNTKEKVTFCHAMDDSLV